MNSLFSGLGPLFKRNFFIRILVFLIGKPLFVTGDFSIAYSFSCRGFNDPSAKLGLVTVVIARQAPSAEGVSTRPLGMEPAVRLGATPCAC